MTYSPNAVAFDLRLSEPVPALESPTARHLECLRWAAAGKSSADIGAIVGLSPRTVDDHLAAACRRLGVRTRVQAVVLALQHQLISTSRG
jgi:DNA-binding CsgD family transcriptional regulator